MSASDRTLSFITQQELTWILILFCITCETIHVIFMKIASTADHLLLHPNSPTCTMHEKYAFFLRRKSTKRVRSKRVCEFWDILTWHVMEENVVA